MVGADSSGNYVILTTTDPSGIWTQVTVDGLLAGANLYGVVYGDKWVIVGNGILLTATDLTTWTTTLFEGTFYNVYYANSIWIMTTPGSGIMVITTLEDFNTWQFISLPDASYISVQYANNVWAVIGNTNAEGIVITTENALGAWIPHQSFLGETLQQIFFADGIWALLSDTTLYTAPDPAGIWTANTLITTIPLNIAYDGVWIYVDGQHNVYTAEDPRGVWTQDTSPSLTPSSPMSNLSLIRTGNTIVITGVDIGLQMFTYTE
jgi:hypothetical protein